jgi:hypothetical protein
MLTLAEYEDVRPQNIYTKQNKKKGAWKRMQ